MEKIICDDNKLEEVIRNVVSEWEDFTSITELFNTYTTKLIDVLDKKISPPSPIELTDQDQFRINKILCKMITNGELIINLVEGKNDQNDIEVAWAGE